MIRTVLWLLRSATAEVPLTKSSVADLSNLKCSIDKRDASGSAPKFRGGPPFAFCGPTSSVVNLWLQAHLHLAVANEHAQAVELLIELGWTDFQVPAKGWRELPEFYFRVSDGGYPFEV